MTVRNRLGAPDRGTAPGMDSTAPDRSVPWTGYRSPDCYDEVFTAEGEVRPQYTALVEQLGRTDLAGRARDIRALIDERGVAFGGEDGHPFALDPIPRILTRDDVYGDQRAVAEGVVPGHTGSSRTSCA